MGTHPIFESDFDCLTEKMTVTEQEVTQYDRQIRLWGLEAQNRLRSSKILLFGLKPLGAEICKNLVLAGIGEIHVCDSEPLTEKTLLMTNGTDFKTISEASKARIEELNPRVKVNLVPGSSKDKDEAFFSDFTLVIITDLVDKSELVRITDIARKKNSKIIVGAQFGLHGIGFNDFQSHDYTFTPDGDGKEEPKMQKASKTFRAFSDVIEAEEPKWTKREKKNQWHIPLHVFKAALESSAALKDEEVNKRFGLESEIIAESTMDVPPVGAILGGVLGQEAIKAIGFKEAPLDNFFIFNGQQMCGNVIKI